MPSLVGDLWPSDLVKPIPSSPIAILKEQALRLGGKTGELVQGDVRPELKGNQVILSFELVMPLLENYRYPLFQVDYQADQVYPLFVNDLGSGTKRCQDSETFILDIKAILSSDRVKSVINSFVDMQRPQPLETEIMG